MTAWKIFKKAFEKRRGTKAPIQFSPFAQKFRRRDGAIRATARRAISWVSKINRLCFYRSSDIREVSVICRISGSAERLLGQEANPTVGAPRQRLPFMNCTPIPIFIGEINLSWTAVTQSIKFASNLYLASWRSWRLNSYG